MKLVLLRGSFIAACSAMLQFCCYVFGGEGRGEGDAVGEPARKKSGVTRLDAPEQQLAVLTVKINQTLTNYSCAFHLPRRQTSMSTHTTIWHIIKHV